MKLNNKSYDILKFALTVGVPALVLLINTLGDTWNWGETSTKVSATVGALGLFCGIFLQYSSSKYNKDINVGGYFDVTGHDEDTGIPDVRLEVTEDPDVLAKGKIVQFKVGQPPSK